MTAPAQSLAAALDGYLIPNGGDHQIITAAGRIYGNFRGQVRVDHRGRIHTLGQWSDGTDALAAAYRRVVGELEVAS